MSTIRKEGEINISHLPGEENLDKLADVPPAGTDARNTRNIAESGKYAGMDRDDFVEDNDDETFENIGRSRGAQGGQPGESRTMGGYRATLKNPRVSEEAKENAKQVLEEHGEKY